MKRKLGRVDIDRIELLLEGFPADQARLVAGQLEAALAERFGQGLAFARPPGGMEGNAIAAGIADAIAMRCAALPDEEASP